MPSPKYERSMNFGNLAGGLNIWELNYRLKPNESPDMQPRRSLVQMVKNVGALIIIVGA